MSSMMMMVLVLGVVAVGIMKRCDWLGMCDAAAAAAATPPPPTAAPTASDSDNDKSQKCGCCNCTQKNTKLITCTTPGGGSIDFSGGLSLDAQCQACAADAKICKNANAAAKQKNQQDLTNKAIKDANDNLTGKQFPGGKSGQNIKCGSGFHLNSNLVCVPNGKSQKEDDKVKGGTNNTGCAAGKTRLCIAAGPGNPNAGKIVCSCSNYTRALSNYTNPYHISNMASSRFARVAI